MPVTLGPCNFTRFQVCGKVIGLTSSQCYHILHLWGTDKQRLIGGGIHADVLNKIIISLMTHRDYKLNNWWLRTGIGFRLSKVKKPKETFNN